MTEAKERPRSVPRTIVRLLLGAGLVFAGVGHLSFARAEFQAQVPDLLPFDPDVTVVASGVVEIVLGLALLVLRPYRAVVGLIVAAFFIAVFPGNIAQWVDGRDGFGLDTDAARFARLFFQPLLVAAALWSTGAWDALLRWRRTRSRRTT